MYSIIYWRPGQPDNWGDEPGEDCGQVIGSSYGQWNDENCGVKRKYICKHINPNPGPQCDLANGWRQYGSNCYKLKADTRKSWAAARHDCVQEGGDLVSITSAGEEQYVTGTLDPSWIDLWIGLSTLKCNKISCQVEAGNSQFTWSDALQVGYTNWANGEPTVDPQTGSCAAIIKDASEEFGKWRSHVCRYERPYMCKRPLNTICPPGWLSFAGSCYWMVSNINLLTTWHEALTKCSDMGAHLLIINSQEEQFFINGNLPDFHQVDIPDIWIGLSDKDQDGVFKWVDKTAVTFSNYGPGWPRNTANLWDCGQIFTGNYDGKWETTNCFKSLGFVCEMTGGQNPKPTSAPDSHCDPGYLLYGDFCYHFETETVKNWQDAEAHCTREQGHLASFHSQEELSFLTAHMPGEAWVGLNDINVENQFVYTDGTPADFLPWGPNQPDNWQDNEDCVHLRGMTHPEPGKLNDDFCTATKEYICKKAKGQGPPPQPPTSGPGWNEKCGSWNADPFNDFCYLFNFLSMRTWAEARADCVNQGGDLISISDPYEQAFIQGLIQASPVGISLWMGGHDSITEGGWEWTDGSPFRYIRWNAGNPDNYYGEDCLSILINNGYWNDDNCENKRGYICKRRGNTPKPPPPHDGFMTAVVCQDSSAVLHCPHESVINIQSAFYGRKSDDICPHLDGSGGGSCTVEGVLPYFRKACDNRPFCFAYAHVEVDPCPTVSKYLEIVYSCEQKVCLHGLGVEDRNITDSQLSASSSIGLFTPNRARLNGNSCWMPSGNPTSSWIQVNLGQTRKVTGIVIQGCPQNDHWLTKFKIQHSMDGTTWTDYTADGQFFPGSTDRNTPDTQLLGTPVSAQYVRILPLEFSGQAGLRFDVLGCTPDYAITCATKPNFNFANDRMTVHCPAGCTNANYRVYGTSVYRGDSNICAAAIHAGVVLNEIGGDCTLLKAAGQDFYPGSTRNGITSRQFDGNYAVSYTFADGELRCSGPDWYEFGEFCYKPFGDRKTWSDARDTCRGLGAELVSILSMTEQSWLESYLYMATSDVWTGLNDLFVPGMFTWSDEHMVTFTYWAPGEPNNHDGFSEDCVEMLHQIADGMAMSVQAQYFVYHFKAHYSLPSVKPTVYGCPQGWDAYGYSCYWMEETARSWSDAKAFCKEQDGFLLHIGDIHFTVVAEDRTLWWIGLRAHGGTTGGVDYVGDNGSPLTFTHWDKDQPDSGDEELGSSTRRLCCQRCESGQHPQSGGGGFLLSLYSKASSKWIGLKDNPTEGGYSWSDGSPLSHTNWGHGEPNKPTRGEECVEMVSSTNGTSSWWNDLNCDAHQDWICMIAKGKTPSHPQCPHLLSQVGTGQVAAAWIGMRMFGIASGWAVPTVVAGWSRLRLQGVPGDITPPTHSLEAASLSGWMRFKNKCFMFIGKKSDIKGNWSYARSWCKEQGGELAVIDDQYENDFVSSYLKDLELPTWIGLSDLLVENQYAWSDGVSPVLYTNWNDKEPNNAGGAEHCVAMTHDPLLTSRVERWRLVRESWLGLLQEKCHEQHRPPPLTEPCPVATSLVPELLQAGGGQRPGALARRPASNRGATWPACDMSYDQALKS
ncbi:macrophage mannose receptor 1 [Lates japonicus]|uniref:Macrophage mannose receptor 1 n=1 Tax=Lates japonicus TaxID=270547 RepID=A0AAD3ML89_LATJO|nr:macrophage mannose receptor 1 [Lates japonicus]